MKLHIAIVDDHLLLNQLLASTIGGFSFVEKVNSYIHPAAFLDNQKNVPYDIIILDLLMPGMNGLELIKEIRKRNKQVKILMLSSVIEIQTIRYALQHGANGYLHKGTSATELATAIQQLMLDKEYISIDLRAQVEKTGTEAEDIDYRLSPQQKEVIRHICAGKTIKEAAIEMGLSVHTVQAYQKNIMRKFKVNRTADLIMIAMNNGLYIPSQSTG